MAVSKIVGTGLRLTRKNVTLGAMGAMESGYSYVTMDANGITNADAQIVSMKINNGYLDSTNGLQLTPMAYNATTRQMYFTHFAPRATQAVTVTAEIWYI